MFSVVPLQIDMKIEGLPETVKTGSVCNITCTILRIKPEAQEMYFTINGKRHNGSIKTTIDDDDHGSLSQSMTVRHR